MNRLPLVYRVLAWIVGLNLLVVFAGFFGKLLTEPTSWWNRNDKAFDYIDQAHGFLFIGLLIVIALLTSRYRWRPPFTITTMVFATIPFVSFWAERRASKALADADAAQRP